MPFPAIKAYLIPLITLLFLLSCRPYSKISGTYYTKQQDALMIDDEKGLLETYGEATVTGLRVKQNRNRILFKWNHSGPIPVIQHLVDRYRFRNLRRRWIVYLLMSADWRAFRLLAGGPANLIKSFYFCSNQPL